MQDNYAIVRTNIGFVIFRNNQAIEVFPTPYGVTHFVMSHMDGAYTIFPCREMARIIEFFYVLDQFLPIVSVKIAAPRLISLTMPESTDPDTTIRCSYDINVHPALGGPRELTHDDFLYAMANLSLETRPNLDIFPILQEHSFWIPANWYNVADVEALARLMACIGDPRWYLEDVDVDSRYEQLYFLLGLHTRRRFVRGFLRKSSANPTMYAFRAWFSYSALQRTLDGATDYANCPGSFFLERLSSHYGISTERFLSAIYNVTREFVASFCELWAHFLTHRSTEDLQYLPVELGNFSSFYQDYVMPLFPEVIGQDAH